MDFFFGTHGNAMSLAMSLVKDYIHVNHDAVVVATRVLVAAE